MIIFLLSTILALQDKQYLSSYTDKEIKQWLYDNEEHITTTLSQHPPYILPFEENNLYLQPRNALDEYRLDRIKGLFVGLALGDAISIANSIDSKKTIENLESKNGKVFEVLRSRLTPMINRSSSVFSLNTGYTLCRAASFLRLKKYSYYEVTKKYHEFFNNHDFRLNEVDVDYQEEINNHYKRQKNYMLDDFKKNFEATTFVEMAKILELNITDRLDISLSSNLYNDTVTGSFLTELAPIPALFYRNSVEAIKISINSRYELQGVKRQNKEACEILCAMICRIINEVGLSKEELLKHEFYLNSQWIVEKNLEDESLSILKGSYQKKTMEECTNLDDASDMRAILEQALWIFWKDKDNIKNGMLMCMQLCENYKKVANIYGQLAGAFYGYEEIPQELVEDLNQLDFIKQIATLLYFTGETLNEKIIEKKVPVDHDADKKKRLLGLSKDKNVHFDARNKLTNQEDDEIQETDGNNSSDNTDDNNMKWNSDQNDDRADNAIGTEKNEIIGKKSGNTFKKRRHGKHGDRNNDSALTGKVNNEETFFTTNNIIICVLGMFIVVSALFAIWFFNKSK